MKISDTRPAHGNSPEWVAREAIRLFPLDLPARIEWIRDMAETSVSETDRHSIYRLLERVCNGV